MTQNQNVIGSRLQERIDAAGHTQSSLARAVGISQTTIAKLVAESSSGSKHLHQISRELGTTPGYLTGQTDDPSLGALPRPTAKQLAEQLDVVEIPEIDLHFGMGGGSIYDSPVQAEKMSFSRAWIRNFTTSPTSQLVFASGTGDSMYPTIHDRDILLIDMSQKTPAMADQIWALTQYGHGMIKRLRPTRDGYSILSDNPSVPPDTAADGSMTIVGRVIAVMRRI